MPATEINFDGLVGPTHNYAGLSHGNLASMKYRGSVSHPRAAALQGLAKMKMLADLGLPQAVLPPQPRPDLSVLRSCGFSGTDREILSAAEKRAPALLAACSSASSMWAANAATTSPSIDTADGRVHFTVANLTSNFHRSIEVTPTARMLHAIFYGKTKFAVHAPIPDGQGMGDEGAANHTRLAPRHGAKGLHIFVYGHSIFGAIPTARTAQRFSSRQALEASEAIARHHGLKDTRVCCVQQSQESIDAGAFHHDVVGVGNENVLLHHERAYQDPRGALAEIRRKYHQLHRGHELVTITVPSTKVSLRDAIRSYLFNSQLVTITPGRMALIVPIECRQTASTRRWIEELLARDATPIKEVHYVDLRESMSNGGGPACLRLRVVLTEAERKALPQGVFLNDRTYPGLVAWVNRHYREKLTPADLADPHLLEESDWALDQLTEILGLGSIYPFQSAG